MPFPPHRRRVQLLCLSKKPKFAKKRKGVATSTPTVYFDTILYGEDLSPIGSIVLEEVLSVVKTYFAKKSAAVKS